MGGKKFAETLTPRKKAALAKRLAAARAAKMTPGRAAEIGANISRALARKKIGVLEVLNIRVPTHSEAARQQCARRGQWGIYASTYLTHVALLDPITVGEPPYLFLFDEEETARNVFAATMNEIVNLIGPDGKVQR